jgi:serine/threonine-protein kinase
MNRRLRANQKPNDSELMPIADRLPAALADRYRIERELGTGGMATVYLAHDVRHDRKVALKVLRPEIGAVLGAERFVKEIRTTAGLQHPHVLPLFDSGTADGFLFYVMPVVEGETLREKLNREKQLDVEEAVQIARDVANALQYAHDHGVIHRDIKPENILLANGQPMVTDFGIALAVDAAAGGRMTETGLSLGTPHYMSPEQAAGDKDITGRSDVYSLAAVLYETLAGEPPHTGKSAQQVMMKIIADDPRPVTKVRKSVPPHVAMALAKALQKLPADRFHSARAFADALGNPAFVAATAVEPGQDRQAPSPNRVAPAGVGAALLLLGALAGVAITVAITGRESTLPQVVRFPLRSPTGTELLQSTRSDVTFALSPDGTRIAFAARVAGEAVNRLYVRTMDRTEAEVIPGTEGALSPFFSPDGQSIGFVSSRDGRIRRVGVDGGDVLVVSGEAAMRMSAPSWGDDGSVVFTGDDHFLRRVGSTGGTSQPVEAGDGAIPVAKPPADTVWVYPFVLPGSRSVVVTPCVSGIIRGAGTCNGELRVLDVASGRLTPLGVQAVRGWHADGYLVFVTGLGALFAAEFDLGRNVLTSEPVRLLDGLYQNFYARTPQVAVSASGTIAYLESPATSDQVIVQVDHRGTEEVLVATPGPYRWLRFSPDQTRIAMIKDAQVHVHDRRSGTTSPVTFGGFNQRPSWSPDGRRLAFMSNTQGRTDVWTVSPDGADSAQPLAPGRDVVQTSATFWTRDGEWIVIDGFPDDTTGLSESGFVGDDIFALPASGGGPMQRVVVTQASEQAGEVSPDGRWIAYVSDDTGDWQVYVQPFLRSGGRTLVSEGPALEPAWASNNELTYTSLTSDSLMLAQLELDDSLGVPAVTRRQALFDRSRFTPGSPSWREYDISRDGQRFLFARSLSGRAPPEPIIVLNWTAEVRRVMAAGRAR